MRHAAKTRQVSVPGAYKGRRRRGTECGGGGWSDTHAYGGFGEDTGGNNYVLAVGDGERRQSYEPVDFDFYAKNIVGRQAGAKQVTVTFSGARCMRTVRILE